MTRRPGGSAPPRAAAPGPGMIVVLMGADGAGKSLLLPALKAALAPEAEVQTFYMGSGDGPSGFPRNILIFLKKRLSSRRPAPRGDRPGPARHPPSTMRGIFEFCWAVALAREKKVKLRRVVRAKRRGIIAICDRYPQASIMGYNDGPLLSALADSPRASARCIARWERRIYEGDPATRPDIVLKLTADPAILHARSPDMALEAIDRKQAGILQLAYGLPTLVAQIDVSQSPDAVLGEALRIISSARSAVGAVPP